MESNPKPQKLPDLLNPRKVKVEIKSLEPPLELEARIRREEEDAAYERTRKKAAEDHERRKDHLLFLASLLIVAVSALACLVSLFVAPSNPWAAPLLTLIVGGLLGYQTGKAQAPKGSG